MFSNEEKKQLESSRSLQALQNWYKAGLHQRSFENKYSDI